MSNSEITSSEVTIEDDDMLQRKEQLKASLHKRDENRIKGIAQKRSEDDERMSKQESDEYFSVRFKEECDALLAKLDRRNLDVSDRVQIANYFEDLSESYQKLLKFLNDSTVFLRSFQLEQAQKTLNQIQTDIATKKQDVLPKKKFAFKSKRKPETVTKEKSSEASTEVKKYDFSANQFDISDRCNETIVVVGDEINQRDLSLSKLRKCRLELYGFPGTVHFSDVKDCLLLCGPVSGSVFVDKCENSKLVTGCQQLRAHNTTDTDFYIHVTSRAIIEDTTRVRFAPYNWTYENLEEDFFKSGLSTEINNWNKVDDFNWLALDTPSPNWSVLPDVDRTSIWTIS